MKASTLFRGSITLLALFLLIGLVTILVYAAPSRFVPVIIEKRTPSVRPVMMTNAPTLTTWTFMVYLSGDNNLDSWTDDLFNNLESVANKANVNILVLWDRHPGGTWDPGTCRYKVQFDTNPGQLAPYIEGTNRWCFGELNTGDKQILFDFITWSKSAYPADYYFLSIFDHGGGWAPELPPGQPHANGWTAGGSGLSWDDTNLDYLSAYDLGWALNIAGPVDVVYYDACLMAMLENAYEIRDSADFLIASENLGYATVPYNSYISAITETTSPADLATEVANLYMASLPPGYSGSVTVMQLSKISDVVTAVDNMAQAINTFLPDAGFREQIASAYLGAQKLDYDGDWTLELEREGFVDLYHFAQQVATTTSHTQVMTTAQGVIISLQNGFVLVESHRSGYPYSDTFANMHGVSVYLPFGEELYVGKACISQTLDICGLPVGPECIKARQYYTTTTPPQTSQLRLAQDTQWDEFANEFIDTYYGCLGTVHAGWRPTVILPQERLINVRNDPKQRPVAIQIRYIYLPLILK